MTQTHAVHVCLVGQSGGPTAVINASLAGVISACREQNIRCLGMRHGIEGFLSGSYIDLSERFSTDEQLDELAHTPGSWLGSCRFKLPDPLQSPELYQKFDTLCNDLHIDCVVYIGGNDSMDTIDKLSRYGKQHAHKRRYIGVPKTIDNDLVGCHTTPGFGSAAKFVASAVSDLRYDSEVYQKPSVVVCEIMGRDAGWLSLASALGGADIQVIPEVPITLERLAERTNELLSTQATVLIGLSEGARNSATQLLCELSSSLGEKDAFGHLAQQSGAGRVVADYLKEQLSVKTRAVEFSTLQRCCSTVISSWDFTYAYAVGSHAVQLATQGETGMMSCYVHDDSTNTMQLSAIPVHHVANKIKTVPHEFYGTKKLKTSSHGISYLAPLISGHELWNEAAGVPLHTEHIAQ